MEYIKVVVSLIGVLLLIFATYYGARWMNRKAQFSQGKALKVIERVNIGPDKCMLIANIGDKYMLLGVSASHIEKICDLTADDLPPQNSVAEGGRMSFGEALKTVIREKTKGGDNK